MILRTFYSSSKTFYNIYSKEPGTDRLSMN